MTIKELAAELGVSKEAVRKHLSKIPASELQKGQRGAVILSPVAVNLIRQLVTTNSDNANDNRQPTDNAQNPDNINKKSDSTVCINCQLLEERLTTANEKIQLLSDNLADIRAELDRKNAELEAKNKQISDLMQALQNEQILHGKVLQLEAPKKKPKLFSIFGKKKDTEQQ